MDEKLRGVTKSKSCEALFANIFGESILIDLKFIAFEKVLNKFQKSGVEGNGPVLKETPIKATFFG